MEVKSCYNPILTIFLQVRGMGMDSPELLLLVENCPKGAETLVTRMLHILTDKGNIGFSSLYSTQRFSNFSRKFSEHFYC